MSLLDALLTMSPGELAGLARDLRELALLLEDLGRVSRGERPLRRWA